MNKAEKFLIKEKLREIEYNIRNTTAKDTEDRKFRGEALNELTDLLEIISKKL